MENISREPARTVSVVGALVLSIAPHPESIRATAAKARLQVGRATLNPAESLRPVHGHTRLHYFD